MLYIWTIFCPGPSLKKLQVPIDYNPAQSIAVNGAILKGFTVAYWTMLDYEVFVSCSKMTDLSIIAKITKLWVRENWLTHMHKWAPEALPAFKLFQCEIHQGKSTNVAPFNKNFIFTRENIALAILRWAEYTIFCAIALAILKGANEIRIFGADMDGEGYFIDGLQNGRINHKSHRWEVELMYFRILKKLCAEQGIEIIREN